jgi:hypothetical protein
MTESFPKFYVQAVGFTGDVAYIKRYARGEYITVSKHGDVIGRGAWDAAAIGYVTNRKWVEVAEDVATAKVEWRPKFYKHKDGKFVGDTQYLVRSSVDEFESFDSSHQCVRKAPWTRDCDLHVSTGVWIEVTEEEIKHRTMTVERFEKLSRIHSKVNDIQRQFETFKDYRAKINDWMTLCLRPETFQAIEDDVNAKIAALKQEFANG